MQEAKSVERAILDRFLQQLTVRDDFPHNVIQRLHQLRKEGHLQDKKKVLDAFSEGIAEDG